MTPQQMVALLEELIDLKMQRYAELHMKLTPDLNRLVRDKRDSDRMRLDQVRQELIRGLMEG
jgi:hypothetical protein